jgi:amidase
MSNKTKQTPKWELLTKRKREQILNGIPPHWRLSDQELQQLKPYQNVCTQLPTFLSPMERAITSFSTADLLSAINVGDYTASEVTSAFSHRATLAHQMV